VWLPLRAQRARPVTGMGFLDKLDAFNDYCADIQDQEYGPFKDFGPGRLVRSAPKTKGSGKGKGKIRPVVAVQVPPGAAQEAQRGYRAHDHHCGT
jgi:hypothetical protein